MIVEGDSYIIWHAMQSGDIVPWQLTISRKQIGKVLKEINT